MYVCKYDHVIIEHSVSLPPPPPPLQSFCSALSQELTEYYRLIAVLDGQLKQQQQEVGVGMTLRRLLVWTHDPRERLQMLAVLVDGCKRKSLSKSSCMHVTIIMITS